MSKFDRAAPFGTGHIKAGGNYACSFGPGAEAKRTGFAEAIYLDPKEHRYIEEIGAANFLAFKGETLVTPDSPSVLPSITRRSLLQIARELYSWQVEKRQIDIAELDDISAAAACGTAAVITWIREIVDGEKTWSFPFDHRWQQLYDSLVGIQTAAIDDPFGWRHEIQQR
ncbi:MAG: aminotransferase class IV [Thermoanaerobaculales bacterium]|nr:aminotransferase class IV [Thermoanaerobaculales bacterium]